MTEMFDPFSNRPVAPRATPQQELRFSDSLEENLGIIQDLISGMPASAQQRARKMAEKLGVVIEQARKESPKDPAIGLGIILAVHHVAYEMTKDNRGLIELL